MDSTAINAIRDLAHAQKTQEILGETKTSSSQVIVPKDYAVVDLEKFDDNPNRFRGTFKTHLISEFVSYVNKNGNSSTGIFVDSEKSTAMAIIDLDGSTLGWGDHRAKIELKKTPEYEAIGNLMLTRLSQDDFIDFVDDFAPNIRFFNDDTTVITSAAITAIRKLTVNTQSDTTSEVGNFKGSLSSFDQIEVSAKVGVMPTFFYFTCIPYEGMEPVQFDCRLRAVTENKAVALEYRVIGIDRVMNQIGLDFLAQLKEGVSKDSAAGFYCGTMEYQGK